MSWKLNSITEEHKKQIRSYRENAQWFEILKLVTENKYTTYDYCCPSDNQFQSYINQAIDLNII